HLRGLRNEAQPPRAGARLYAQEVGLAEPHMPLSRLSQACEAGQEGGLARAVRPEDRGHRAGLKRCAHPGQHLFAAQPHVQVLGDERVHAILRRIESSRAKKNGPPSADMATPSFTSLAAGVRRTRMSAASTST